MNEDKPLLGVAHLVKLFGVSPSTVQRWTRNGHPTLGKLPFVQQLPGGTGAYLFNEDAVLAWKSRWDELPEKQKWGFSGRYWATKQPAENVTV